MSSQRTSFHIGMRNVKTSLAVLICLGIFLLFNRDPTSACIAALIAMQGTLEESLTLSRNRLIGIIIGGILGAAFATLGLSPVNSVPKILLTSFGITLVILICNIVYRQDATVMGCVTFLGIVLVIDAQDMNPWLYSLGRMLDNSAGIIIAVAVNRLIRPPKKTSSTPPQAPVNEALPQKQPTPAVSQKPNKLNTKVNKHKSNKPIAKKKKTKKRKRKKKYKH